MIWCIQWYEKSLFDSRPYLGKGVWMCTPAPLTGLSSGPAAPLMEEVTTGLLSKVVEIAFPGEARRKKFQWLSQAEYLDGEGIVLVQLHDSLKPFLLALKREFAKIPLLEILRLRSRYAMAFYQMCCSWYGSNGRSWTLTVDELRAPQCVSRIANLPIEPSPELA